MVLKLRFQPNLVPNLTFGAEVHSLVPKLLVPNIDSPVLGWNTDHRIIAMIDFYTKRYNALLTAVTGSRFGMIHTV